MSGGHFEYASLDLDLDDLLRGGHREQWRLMAEDLERAGHDDVAADVFGLLDYVTTILRRVEGRLARLQPVARELEWWRSGDASPERVAAAAERYRQGPPDPVYQPPRHVDGSLCTCPSQPGPALPEDPPPEVVAAAKALPVTHPPSTSPED